MLVAQWGFIVEPSIRDIEPENGMEETLIELTDLLQPRNRRVILNAIVNHTQDEFTVQEVVFLTNLDDATVERHLNFFTRAGILENYTDREIKFYNFTRDNLKPALRRFFDAWDI